MSNCNDNGCMTAASVPVFGYYEAWQLEKYNDILDCTTGSSTEADEEREERLTKLIEENSELL